MQGGGFPNAVVSGYEWAVETALGRQEEGRTISWVRLAYDRVMDDVLWMSQDDRTTRRVAIVTLLQFEWGLNGEGHWEPVDFDEDTQWFDENDNPLPEFLKSGRSGDIIGHTEPSMENQPSGPGIWPANVTIGSRTTFWRRWPSGWEQWVPEV